MNRMDQRIPYINDEEEDEEEFEEEDDDDNCFVDASD